MRGGVDCVGGGIVGGSVGISDCLYFSLSIDLGSILRLREEYSIIESGGE